MAFIPFMLCERLTDPARLQERRYVAEPKLDGQRSQLHVRQGRTVAGYSRRGLDLLRHAGMVWLRELKVVRHVGGARRGSGLGRRPRGNSGGRD